MWFCGRRIRAGRSTDREIEKKERVTKQRKREEALNRAFYIILVPALLVGIGYLFVFRSMGITPPYWLLSFALVLFAGAIWRVGRRRKEVMK